MDQLLGRNEGDSDGEDRDDDGGWKPRVLGLHPCSKHDDNNGQVCWDSNEHHTDRFNFYFEFHSTMGVMPPYKLINMLRQW